MTAHNVVARMISKEKGNKEQCVKQNRLRHKNRLRRKKGTRE